MISTKEMQIGKELADMAFTATGWEAQLGKREVDDVCIAFTRRFRELNGETVEVGE